MRDIRPQLEAAQAKGLALFDAVERAGLIAPGRSEIEVDRDVYELARTEFGIENHWHRRIVRAGENTLRIYSENPPVRIIGPDDTVFLDLGPVIGEWQADLGRTYALGSDPRKKRLVADLPRLFDIVQAHYHAQPDMTGAALHAFAQKTAEEAGWLFGGTIAGHTIVGGAADAPLPGDKARNHIAPGNGESMRLPDGLGRPRHWILEIHLVDRERTFGGFYERLL